MRFDDLGGLEFQNRAYEPWPLNPDKLKKLLAIFPENFFQCKV
jgi:hypothetical protein